MSTQELKDPTTKRTQSQHELEEQLRLFVEYTPAAVAMLDHEMRYLLVSRRWLVDYEVGDRDLIGHSHYEIFPEISERWKEIHRRCLAGAVEKCEEEAFARADGTTIWLKWEIHPWTTNAGEIGGIIMFTEVISERKRIEKELRQSQQMLQLVIDNIPQLIFWKDRNSVYLGCNRNFAGVAGLDSPEEIVGKTDYDLPWKQEESDFFCDCDARIMAADTPEYHIIEPQLKADGKQSWVDTNKIPLHDADGKVVGILGTFEDITVRKQVEEALRDVNEQLEIKVDERTTELRNAMKQLQGEIQSRQHVEVELRRTLQQASLTQDMLKLVMDNIPQFIFWKDRNFVFLGCNRNYASIVGLESPEEIVGKTDYDLPWKQEQVEFFRECDARVMETDTPEYHIIEPAIQADGKHSWLDTNKIPLHDVEGNVVGILGTFEDITKRKRAEEALKESEERYRYLYNNTPVMLHSIDGSGRLISVSNYWLDTLGYDKSEVIGRNYFEFLTETSRCYAKEVVLPEFLRTGVCKDVPYQLIKKNGETIDVLLSEITERNEAGEIVRSLAVLIDITARKQAEEALRQSEARLRELLAREELLNRLASQIRSSLDLNTILETAVQEIRNLLHIDRCFFVWYRPDALAPHWEVVREAKNFTLPSLIGFQMTNAEIGPIATKTLNKEIIRVDDVQAMSEPVAMQFFVCMGYTAVLSLPIHTQSGEIGALACVRCSGFRPWRDSEVEMLCAVADSLAIAINQAQLYKQSRTAAKAAQAQAQMLELTLQELQQTQAQLVQTEKMSSLGQLVAGVAHEINNPVNFIYGNLVHADEYTHNLLHLLQLYAQHYPQPVAPIADEIEAIDLDFLIEDLPKMLASMRMGAERIRQIVLSLRNFSRLDEAEMKPVDIHAGLDSTLLLLQNRLKVKVGQPAVEVLKEYSDLPLVECYAGQLNQVFMNLLTNAIDVLESAVCSKLSVATHNPHQTQDKGQIRICTEIRDGDRVVVRIVDNGPGMSEAVRQRLFDPFFTTKPVGKGTGLGLAISYQIVVEKHGGQLQCISAPGQGAEFVVEIPIHHPTLN